MNQWSVMFWMQLYLKLKSLSIEWQILLWDDKSEWNGKFFVGCNQFICWVNFIVACEIFQIKTRSFPGNHGRLRDQTHSEQIFFNDYLDAEHNIDLENPLLHADG